MPDDNQWAGYVRAHRLAQNMNQGEFAVAMGVSQQTVSRWESGSQIPDASIQDRLRTQLQKTALGSLNFWKRRVSASHGHELLVARDLTILAASEKAIRMIDPGGGKVAGANISNLLPEPDVGAAEGKGLNSIAQLAEIGFFDGLIRSVRIKAEWFIPIGSCICSTDIWPILTSDQTIVGHIAGMPQPIESDPNGFKGIRVLDIEIHLNKDM